MKNALQWLRSLLFIILMYLGMAAIALVMFPMTLIHEKWVFRTIHWYCHGVRWLARVLVGLKSEIRGPVPQGEVIVASKHQSFFDILLIASAVPRLKFIMKKQLIYVPIIGYYGRRTGSIPVDRGKRGVAIKKMVADVKAGRVKPGQLIIFPQGTRVAAGAVKPYKVGTAVLYRETGQPVVPAATNVGVFWKRHGIMRYPGTAVLEFLPTIEPGLETDDFMAKLEVAVESASDRLMAEAGFKREGPVDAE